MSPGTAFAGESSNESSIRLESFSSAGHAGFEKKDRLPNPVGFATLDHFQRLESGEGFIGLKEPISNRSLVHNLREGFNNPPQLDQTSERGLADDALFFDFRQLSF